MHRGRQPPTGASLTGTRQRSEAACHSEMREGLGLAGSARGLAGALTAEKLPDGSNVRLFSNFKRVVHLDAKVTHGRLKPMDCSPMAIIPGAELQASLRGPDADPLV